jgi:mono/diheme cytochrome c family protein
MTKGTVQRLFGMAVMAALLPATVLSGWYAAAEEAARPKDYLQRSLEIYEFKKAANSGPERGQEIFYYKCWFCHNEFATAIPQQGIPYLKGIYQKPNLLSGEPVSDATVREKIKNGGPGMPAYKYVLNDADLNDLVGYLREKCCWDSDAPPPNPRFRAN